MPEATAYRKADRLNPWQLFAICMSVGTEGVQITLPYVLAVYMIRTFLGEHPDERRVGRLTGTLTSCFCAAQFLTAYSWGLLSDRIGRKYLVLMSNCASVLFSILFGSSQSYWQAAAARFLGGFFNASFGNTRSMIADSLNVDCQAKALGYVSMSWALGAIAGPVIGGAFAFPCQPENFGQGFPLCGPGQLFAREQFLLPCIIAACFSVVAALSSAFILPETLPRIVLARRAAAAKERGHDPDSADLTAPLIGGKGEPPEEKPLPPVANGVSSPRSGPPPPSPRGSGCSRPRPVRGSMEPAKSWMEGSPFQGMAVVGPASYGSQPSRPGTSPRRYCDLPQSLLAKDLGLSRGSTRLSLDGTSRASPRGGLGTPRGSRQGSQGATPRAAPDGLSASTQEADLARRSSGAALGRALSWGLRSPRGSGPGAVATEGRPRRRSITWDRGSHSVVREESEGDLSSLERGGEGAGTAMFSPFAEAATEAAVEAGREQGEAALEAAERGEAGGEAAGSRGSGGPAGLQSARSGAAGGTPRTPRGAPLGERRHSRWMEEHLRAMVEPRRSFKDLQAAAGSTLHGKGEPGAEGEEDGGEGGEGAEDEDEDDRRPWYRHSLLLRLVAGYGLVAMFFNISDEVTPLFAATDTRLGGLGLSSSQLSIPLSCGGAFLAVWATLGYPRVQKRYGPLFCCRSGLLAAMPLVLCVPATSLLTPYGPVATICGMVLALGLRNLAGQNAFSSSTIMINLVAPPSQMGQVNGAAQTLAAFVRAIGPAIGGWTWAYSLDVPLGGHQFLAFAIVAVGLFAARILYGTIHIDTSAIRAREVGRSRGPSRG